MADDAFYASRSDYVIAETRAVARAAYIFALGTLFYPIFVLWCCFVAGWRELIWPVTTLREMTIRTWREERAKRKPSRGSRLLPRKRRLSVSNVDCTDPPCNLQNECLLFKLPWDIRSKIYGLVLSGRIVYVKQVMTRDGAKLDQMKSHVCKHVRNPDVSGLDHEAWIHMPNAWRDACFHGRPNPMSVSLIKSCRRVYSETIDLIYATNIFFPQEYPCLFQLGSFLLPQRFHAIRNLDMDLTLPIWSGRHGKIFYSNIKIKPHRLAEFRFVLDFIGSMKGLTDVRLNVESRLQNCVDLGWWEAIHPLLTEISVRCQSINCRVYVWTTRTYYVPGHEWYDEEWKADPTPVVFEKCLVYGKTERDIIVASMREERAMRGVHL